MPGRPVAVVVRVPRLAVDRPFTYLLPDGADAGVGSLVQVPFHGRSVQAWVLGDTDDVPARVAEIRRPLSPVRFFDERLLALYRWLAHRYLTPLSVAIDRGIPPRVVSEEGREVPAPGSVAPGAAPAASSWLDATAPVLVRPVRGSAAEQAVAHVAAVLERGRSAIVVVPETDSYVASRVRSSFGEAVATFIGGEDRQRYRLWLDILGGRYRVVVGTRPAVFAPVRDLGLIWIDRDAHAGHREERSPAWHVRDVALARGRIERAPVAVAALVPSAEAVAAGMRSAGSARDAERRAWPLVETVKPGPEGRAARIVEVLRGARSGFLLSSRGGYGVARVCRACGEAAACARCAGVLEQRRGVVACSVCGSPGECSNCGGRDFGIQRRGSERIAEWAARVAAVPVREAEGPPEREEITVGTPASVPDAGPRSLDVVGILDADRMLRRPGLSGPERVVSTWFEAASWARPRPHGRVIVETSSPGDGAVQALVRGDPEPFLRRDAARRADAGFPPGHPVFRIACTGEVAERIGALRPETLLVSGLGDERVCLVTVSPGALDAFVTAVRAWARTGEVRRVDAEPHL